MNISAQVQTSAIAGRGIMVAQLVLTQNCYTNSANIYGDSRILTDFGMWVSILSTRLA